MVFQQYPMIEDLEIPEEEEEERETQVSNLMNNYEQWKASILFGGHVLSRILYVLITKKLFCS